jgi:hypothetical protein
MIPALWPVSPCHDTPCEVSADCSDSRTIAHRRDAAGYDRRPIRQYVRGVRNTDRYIDPAETWLAVTVPSVLSNTNCAMVRVMTSFAVLRVGCTP